MKLPTILLFFCSITVSIAQPVLDRHYVSTGGYIPVFSNQTNFILTTSYEHRFRSGKKPLGVGVTVDFAKFSIVGKKDFGVTPRLYFHLLEKTRADVYIGAGIGYAQQTQLDNSVVQKSGVALKYYFGMRYSIQSRAIALN